MHNLIRKSLTNLTNVSMNITKHLLSNQKLREKNVVFSPLSLNTVLSMIATGSEGPTQKQLLSFLQSESPGDLKSLCSRLVSSVLSDRAPAGGPCLSYTNGVWVEQSLPLQPSFKQLMTTDSKLLLLQLISSTRYSFSFLTSLILNPPAMLLLVFYLLECKVSSLVL